MKTLEILAGIGVVSIIYWSCRTALKVKEIIDDKTLL